MRKIFEFFSIFDWISPAIAIGESIVNDPTLLQSNSWTFFIPYDQSLKNGWNAVEIEKLMQKHGIKTWGSLIVNGEYFFSCDLTRAKQAEWVLSQNGIPVMDKSREA